MYTLKKKKYAVLAVFIFLGFNLFAQHKIIDTFPKANQRDLQQKEPIKYSLAEGMFSEDGPLYVVMTDGKELNTKNEHEFKPYISPDNIESIKVLKYAESSKKYGDAAKNGVIQIVLKEGTFTLFPKMIQKQFKIVS